MKSEQQSNTDRDLHNNVSIVNLKLARADSIERVKLRDQALFIYIASIGTYLAYIITKGYSSTDEDLKLILMAPLPFVCLAFTIIVLQHHDRITAIYRYTREIYFLQTDGSRLRSIYHLDASPVAQRGIRSAWLMRFFAQVMLLSTPQAYSIYYAGKRLITGDIDGVFRFFYLLLLTIDLCSIIYTVYLHVRSKQLRDQLEINHPGESDKKNE